MGVNDLGVPLARSSLLRQIAPVRLLDPLRKQTLALGALDNAMDCIHKYGRTSRAVRQVETLEIFPLGEITQILGRCLLEAVQSLVVITCDDGTSVLC